MKLPQIKQSEKKISEDKPWGDDKLKRRECAETLTRLLEGQTEPLTISINGEWGSGKTFMLRRWRQDLENQGYTAIYFNAWEDDFIADPLIAIIGQLWQNLKGSTYEEICNGVKTAAVPLLKKVGIGLLNNGIEKLTGTNLAEIAQEELQSASESAFDNYAELTSKRDDLKKRLQELADKVFEETGNPLVFIIDELDRCRPTFAIELMERVKHLFDIKHMVFVLGIDREQLGKSIQSVYGDIDVNNYLHRFIDLDFMLPETTPELFITAIWKHCKIQEHLIEKSYTSNSMNLDINEGAHFKKFLSEILCYHEFSLREIEQTLKMYCLLLRSTPATQFTWPKLTAILLVLKIKNPVLYRKYVRKKCNVEDIADYFLPKIEPKHAWWCEVSLSIIYSTFCNEYSQTASEKAIENIMVSINENKPIKGLPHAAKYMEICSTEALKRIVTSFFGIRNRHGESERYYDGALIMIAKKVDLIMSGANDPE